MARIGTVLLDRAEQTSLSGVAVPESAGWGGNLADSVRNWHAEFGLLLRTHALAHRSCKEIVIMPMSMG